MLCRDEKMREAAGQAEQRCNNDNWIGTVAADIAFRVVIISLGGTLWLPCWFSHLLVELRLLFSLLDDLRHLYASLCPAEQEYS